MAVMGSWDWVEATGGRLTVRRRFGQIARAALIQAGRRLRGRAAARARGQDPEALTPPDSAVVKAAEALAAEACAPWLYNHSVRAYVWARLIEPDLKPDLEALYVAALLHDIGLTDRLRAAPGECFTLTGARQAARLAEAHGWSGARARLTADAICLHLNLSVGAKQGPEAQMLRLGTAADVVGEQIGRLDAESREAVLARWPRRGFKREIAAAFGRDAAASPCCRSALLWKLGLPALIERAPHFAE